MAMKYRVGNPTNLTAADVDANFLEVKTDATAAAAAAAAANALAAAKASSGLISASGLTAAAAGVLSGRGAGAGAGALGDIALGTNLSMTGNTLNAAGGGSSTYALLTDAATAALPTTNAPLAAALAAKAPILAPVALTGANTLTQAAHFNRALSWTGAVTAAQALSGTATEGDYVELSNNGTAVVTFTGATAVAGFRLDINPGETFQAKFTGSQWVSVTASDPYLSTINSQSAAYTLVATDAGKTIFHPAADVTPRGWVIPSNAAVPFPIGTIVVIDNDAAAGAITLSITADQLVLIGAAGALGSYVVGAGQRAVIQKVTATRWRLAASGIPLAELSGLAAGIATFLATPTSANLLAALTNEEDLLGVSAINSISAAYTLALTDAGKTLYHPSADVTARLWTIPANASVPFPVGAVVTIDNDDAAGALTIAITTDTLVLVGTAGTTGSRTLAEGGRAVLQKVTATRWRISGGSELT